MITGLYVCDLAGLLTRPYPIVDTWPSRTVSITRTVAKIGDSSQGAHSSTVCPGFPPGSLFTQGDRPQAPNLAANLVIILELMVQVFLFCRYVNDIFCCFFHYLKNLLVNKFI
jgi:hypothetical protein